MINVSGWIRPQRPRWNHIAAAYYRFRLMSWQICWRQRDFDDCTEPPTRARRIGLPKCFGKCQTEYRPSN
jgi:hypothetical protein